jgi:hypothetical protein
MTDILTTVDLEDADFDLASEDLENPDLVSEADVEGGSSDEEDVDVLKCPKCNHDNNVQSVPHKCNCGFIFEQGPGGFVKDGFVVSDDSDTTGTDTGTEEEEEEEEDYSGSSSEEEEEEEEEEDSESDGEWRPKKKAKRSE